ncbi:DUF6583 family protein [Aquibacillus kalidii]|uniref:DUF6583 family protein n=1 Tax=Aquibacillus kalidii TaxID=2762597 RepID=UPI0016493ABB|nr:DUF6583 family protein [Aquibacillus kalidii]
MSQKKEEGISLEQEQNVKKSSRKTVWIVALVAVAIIVVASISASALLKKNPKEEYFSAELKSAQFMTDVVKDRYSDEFAWAEEVKKKPSESTVELSAEFNDPSGFDSTGMQSIINSSSITLKNSLDPEKKEMAMELSANVAEMPIEDIKFYLTADKMMASLPFLDKFLQVNESDLGALLYELDPMTFTGEEEYKFETFFNQTVLSEEDKKHFQDTYLKMIYDELPEEAFTSKDEKVEVNGEEVKASKITLKLSEEKLKSIIEKVLTEMEKDEKLKDLIKQQASLDPVSYSAGDLTQILEDFETGIADVKKELKDFQIPNGLTSTLWIKDELVVKRDFSIEMGPSESELAKLTVTGTQSLTKEKQSFDYELGFKDDVDEGVVNITGDLSWKDKKADDKITIAVEDMELSYTGTEELKDGTREFDRSFAMKDPASMSNFELSWDGSSTYEKDQMNGEHHFALVGEGISSDIFQLNVNNDAKIVKSLDIDTDSKEVVDLGAMSAEEIQTYMMEEAMPQFQQWMMGFYGSLNNANTGF